MQLTPVSTSLQKAMQDPFNTNQEGLPPEVVLHIFSFLGSLDLMRCEVVCKDWHKFIKGTPSLQRNILNPLFRGQLPVEVNPLTLRQGGFVSSDYQLLWRIQLFLSKINIPMGQTGRFVCHLSVNPYNFFSIEIGPEEAPERFDYEEVCFSTPMSFGYQEKELLYRRLISQTPPPRS